MIKFKLEEGVQLPQYESEGAAGFDVTAFSIMKAYKGDSEVVGDKLEKMKEGFQERGYIKIRPFERILFSSGLTVVDIIDNLELQVRSRSGISLKRGLFVANQPGTIDSDYRGTVGIIIYNSTPFLAKVEKGERIAQLVPKEVVKPPITSDNIITETERGSGGFGSTGTKEDLV
jgi:dUTP pyrophosphatase